MKKTVVQNLVSGDWHVRAGAEEEFVLAWKAFLDWTRASAPGFLGARLIRDLDDPRHHVSFAEWESHAARQAWRARPGFAERMGACRALCEDMRGANYDLVAAM